MYMRYLCYHSYVHNYHSESLAQLVERLGGWVEPCMIGMYVFVPEHRELLVVLFDPELVRRVTLDYITD